MKIAVKKKKKKKKKKKLKIFKKNNIFLKFKN